MQRMANPDSSLVWNKMSELYCNDLMSDVIFLVGGERKRVPGHKFVLALCSSVFDNVFKNLKLDKKELLIEDVTYRAFLCFLKYCYSGNVSMNEEIDFDVLKLASRFNVPGLIKICEDYLLNMLDRDSCLTFYSKCSFLNNGSLFKKKILNFIGFHFRFLVKTEATLEVFLSLSQKQLIEIAELEGLNCEEFELFNVLMTWAQHNCLKLQIPCTPKNLREILGDGLYKIRFPIFSKEEIFEVFAEFRHILTHNEIRDIIQSYRDNATTHCNFSNNYRNRFYSLCKSDFMTISGSERSLVPCFKNQVQVEFDFTKKIFIELTNCKINTTNVQNTFLNGFGIVVEKNQDPNITLCTLSSKYNKNILKIHKSYSHKLNSNYDLHIAKFSRIELYNGSYTLCCEVDSAVPFVKLDDSRFFNLNHFTISTVSKTHEGAIPYLILY